MTRTAFGPPSCLKDDKGLSRRLPMNYSSKPQMAPPSFVSARIQDLLSVCVNKKKKVGGRGLKKRL